LPLLSGLIDPSKQARRVPGLTVEEGVSNIAFLGSSTR